jgi:uncharacterized repeat protein (TIGR01451 family)
VTLGRPVHTAGWTTSHPVASHGMLQMPFSEGAPTPEIGPMPRLKDGQPPVELHMPRPVEKPADPATPSPAHTSHSALLLPTPPPPPPPAPTLVGDEPRLSPELTLTKTGPATAEIGQAVEHTITLQNQGRKEATQVVVIDHLPPEVSIDAAPEGARLAGREIHWTLGTVPPGAVRTLRVQAKAAKPGARIINRASAHCHEGSGATASAALRIAAPQTLKLEVYDMVDPVPLGEETEYLVRVSNKGTTPVSGLQLQLNCPAELKPIALLGGPKDIRLGAAVLIPAFDLAPGAAKSFRLKAQALKAGDVKISVKLITPEPDQMLTEEETTSISLTK